MTWMPGRRERRVTCADHEQLRSRRQRLRAATDCRIGDGNDSVRRNRDPFAIELEDRLSLEDQIELLLAAPALVVLLDERLLSALGYEQVHPKVSIPRACWSGYQAGSSRSPSETVGTAAIALTVQRAITGAYAASVSGDIREHWLRQRISIFGPLPGTVSGRMRSLTACAGERTHTARPGGRRNLAKAGLRLRARPPDYDDSSARRDHQVSAAVTALSASWMSSPTSPAVAAQCRGTRARAPGSQRCSSGVSGSGAVPS